MDPHSPTTAPQASGPPSDEEIARRVVAGETALFELLMRRHNQRVYRAIRGVLRNETEIEDAMQQAYLSAYLNLGRFQGGSRFSTWLVRIALNEALMRVRSARKFVVLDGHGAEESPVQQSSQDPSPEELAARSELRGALEHAIDGLPDLYRTVLILRDVEGLSTAESSQVLETSEDVVKTRLHRARSLLKDRLASLTAPHLGVLFEFHAPRCDRVVAAVMEQIGSMGPGWRTPE
jgi:RNA polymerase sigma-70 factor (ECF subfamily)